MLKIILFFLFSFFFLTNSSLSQEKIVFIDINYIFKNSVAGKNLHEQISKKDNELKEEIAKFKNEIETEKKKILSKKNVISVEEYNKEVNKLEKKIKSVNSMISQKNDELSIFKKKIETLFSRELNVIIEEYSLANSINLILNKENLLMAKKNLDITEQIFSIFNTRVNKINLN